MEMFLVRGGVPLRGRVKASGSKNAALPIMAAALMADGPSRIQGVPDLVDVRTMSQLLTSLGLWVERDGEQVLLETREDSAWIADYELVRRMRASVCVLGPLLARRRQACVSLPGGCNIGDRPIDLHLKGLAALGAEIEVHRGYVVARAQRLTGARVYLGGRFGTTVTGTCNVMCAAALARGTTLIEAAACEPEVVDLGQFLRSMGAQIDGLGTPTITIDGVERLSGAEHRVIPDRIEVATLLMAAAITGGSVAVDGTQPQHLTAVLEKLAELQVDLETDGSTITARQRRPLCGADCTALPYPGIPTDVQAQLMALLSVSRSRSVVTDCVFPDRFMHASELVRMGARIRREGAAAVIDGVEQLTGASVMASDLRASAALVLAGLAASGESVIRRIYHLDRGYERLDEKLNQLGASVQRVEDRPENLPDSLRRPIHDAVTRRWKKSA